ncbi:MAG: hypothetical protein ACLUMN_07395 [Oscillospiraceae bacterium]
MLHTIAELEHAENAPGLRHQYDCIDPTNFATLECSCPASTARGSTARPAEEAAVQLWRA